MSGQGIVEGLGWRHVAPPVLVLAVAGSIVAPIAGLDAMTAWLATMAPVIALVVVFWLVPALVPLRHSPGQGVLALVLVGALFALNTLVLTLPRIGPFAELDWNWQGKTLDLFWCLAIITLLTSAQRREIGWTFRVHPGTLGPAFINILIIAIVGFFVLGANAPGTGAGTLTLERVLFDTTHPNLVEEIVFRGFMLALLDRAFPPRWEVAGAKIGWGVVLTAWLFGLVHGIAPNPDGGIVFDPVWLALSFAAGLIIGWIRALTGSLWPAFLAHCAPEIGILFALALD